MSGDSRCMPDGKWTNDFDEYCKAWAELGAKFCEVIGKGKVSAFDPDILVFFDDGLSLAVPPWLAYRVIELGSKCEN